MLYPCNCFGLNRNNFGKCLLSPNGGNATIIIGCVIVLHSSSANVVTANGYERDFQIVVFNATVILVPIQMTCNNFVGPII